MESMSTMGVMSMTASMPHPSTTSSTMSMGNPSHSMSPMSMGSMSSQMVMVFFTSTDTPLFSHGWKPSSVGEYAGTCIFLIILATILRALYAFKALLEARWQSKALRRRFIQVVPESGMESPSSHPTKPAADVENKSPPTAVLTTNGISENVKLVEKKLLMGATFSKPWRMSEDLPRAFLVTIMVGVGYLLMLAVMTMNVGYFLSVLAGAFTGELFFGRYTGHVEDHH